MFIQGHNEIIEDVLKKLPNYFDTHYSHVTKEKLLKGSSYVDLPCGYYELSDDNKHFIFHSRKLCHVSKLVTLLYETPFSANINIFQYHRGFFAYLHSMTTDPENTNLKIRDKIVLSIISYALLAIYDDLIFSSKKKFYPNILWIGIILHMITDSYSPSHTIRSKKVDYTIHNKIYNYSKYKSRELVLHEKIKQMAKENKVYDSSSFKTESQYNTYKIFKFEFDTNNIASKYIKNKFEYENYRDGDIICFQYSPNQPMFLHQQLDFMYIIKSNKKLYKKMMSECKEVLEIYKEVLLTKDVNRYINKMLELVLTKTFRMSNKHLKEKTNKIVNPDLLY